MNTSMNEAETELKQTGGAFADGLTLIRALLTPVVMFLIVFKGWPAINTALLVSILFAIAALTDLFDDLTGGAANSIYRKFGWFDDIADTVLMIGTLAAMTWMILSSQHSNPAANGYLDWLFLIAVSIIILREIIVGLLKGFELSRMRGYETGLSHLKTAFIMLGTCILLASPWLTPWVTTLFSKNGDFQKTPFDLSNPALSDPSVFDAYIHVNGWVWTSGLVILWIGALLSLMTGIKLIKRKFGTTNDG